MTAESAASTAATKNAGKSDEKAAGVASTTATGAGATALKVPDDADYVLRGITADGMVRAFAATTRRTVQAAREAHGTSPVVTAALGRLLTAAAMMGAMVKDPDERLTLSVRGDGPVLGLTVTADARGHVRGFAGKSDLWIPEKASGKLDVGTAVGKGTLQVVTSTPWGDPYVSEVALASGEIGDDIAAYYADSEQTASSVGVGVLVDTDLSVRQAGGFIVQLMPDCPDAVIDRLETNLRGLRPISSMLDDGMGPLDMLGQVLAGLDFIPLEASPVEFLCACDYGTIRATLVSLGADEMQSLIEEGKPARVVCHFCNKEYDFDLDELARMRDEAREAARVAGSGAAAPNDATRV